MPVLIVGRAEVSQGVLRISPGSGERGLTY